jgi:NitT/TauT family transport system ATP-binding protein
MQTEKVLVKDISLSYGHAGIGAGLTPALADINLQVAAGEFVAIIGPSGCGKSTLLKVISGLSRQSAGTVRIDGDVVQGVPKRMGFLFQSDALLPWKCARENVAIGAMLSGSDAETANAVADSLLEDLGLGKASHKFPSELSGGMRKRVTVGATGTKRKERGLPFQRRASLGTTSSEYCR